MAAHKIPSSYEDEADVEDHTRGEGGQDTDPGDASSSSGSEGDS